MNFAVDLLVVNPPSREEAYQVLAKSLAAIEPPVWVGLVANFVRKRGYSVAVLDANAEGLGASETAQRIAEYKPRLTCVMPYGHNPSASTQVMAGASPTCRALKQGWPELPVIMVGGHAAALPRKTLREEAVDFVCDGEGPYTLCDLIDALKAGDEDYSKVPGLLFRDRGLIRASTPAPLVKNLDQEMPGVAWDLFDMGRYRAHNWHCFDTLERQPYAAIYTTLGCPYRCSFCCIQAPFKSGEQALGYKDTVNSYRFWGIDNVLGQIDTLVNDYGVRNIKVADEMFVLNRRHVEAVCDGIIERGYDLNIWAYARVDTVKDGLLPKLKRAGFNWLGLGIESANENVRDGVDKGFEQQEMFDTIAEIKREGIHIGANYIFGLPDDDRASMQQTFDLAEEINAEWANFYCTMAYPGSGLYQQAIENGWPLPETWSGYSQYSVDSFPLQTKTLASAEVLAFRDAAFKRYYNNPVYRRMLEERFGRLAIEHIDQMLSHELVRKFSTSLPERSENDVHISAAG